MDHAAATELFALTDRELWLVTSRSKGRRGGCIATFVSHASLVSELPRVLVAVARQHHTWELIESSGAFALHLLAEANLEWVWRFGLQSGRQTDKLEGLSTTEASTGSPLLTGALGWLDCRVEAQLDSGDRSVYLAEVVAAQCTRRERPLTVGRLLQVAPRERLEQLKLLRERDAAIDAEAIRRWRAARLHEPEP